jgi:hypothetical protein
MKTDPNLWRELRVGDRIRFVEYPREFLRPGYFIHRETVRVYRKLLKRKRPLSVWEIDEYGAPWVACRFRLRNGKYEHHTLKVNHDGFVRVRSRNR